MVTTERDDVAGPLVIQCIGLLNIFAILAKTGNETADDQTPRGGSFTYF